MIVLDTHPVSADNENHVHYGHQATSHHNSYNLKEIYPPTMTTATTLPKILQIEPTNACNFNCEMCLHALSEQTPPTHMSIEIYQRLARDVFPALESLILFGWGEPLMHPEFIPMLKIARANLRTNAKIKVTSNGSLLTPQIIDTILNENLADSLNISCDMPPGNRCDFPGHHNESERVVSNLDYLMKHPWRSRLEIGIDTVIMRSNIAALPALVEQFGKRGADSILASHVFPYHPQLEAEMLYTLMSSEAWDIFEAIGDVEPQDWFGIKNDTSDAGEAVTGFTPKQANLLAQAREDGIMLNYSLYLAVKKRTTEFENTRMLLKQAADNAEHFGIQLDLPPLFGSIKERACPYVQSKASVIRSDGAVVPCFKNLHPHSAYFNGRTRTYTPHVFGSLEQSSFTKIWNSDQYRQFRSDMHTMNEHIAWCGDCSFSLYYCYFSEEAPHDCMLNKPFCSDCPFSLDLTRCVL